MSLFDSEVMSRSYHTDPKRCIAARNVKLDVEGRPVLPRVVEKAPRIGDIHPLSGRTLSRMLKRLPLELWYGLKTIELRARQGEVGHPFGSYSPSAKTIHLYSLPEVLELTRVALSTGGAAKKQIPISMHVQITLKPGKL